MKFLNLSDTLLNRIERIYLFARTDYFIRYYGSRLGVMWAFINPFVQVLVLYLVFVHFIFKQNSPMFLLSIFSGQIFWQFFSESTNASISLFKRRREILQNTSIKKIDFFVAGIISKFLGFIISLLIFFVIYISFYEVNIGLSIFYLPLIIISWILYTLAFTFFLATLNLFLRDMQHLWGLFMIVGYWIIPIMWDYNLALTKFTFLQYYPPICVLINVRQILLYNLQPSFFPLWYSFIVSVILAISGYFFMILKSKKALEVL